MSSTNGNGNGSGSGSRSAARTFRGFIPLDANFTLTPNQFFDQVVGKHPYCVVIVVARLIRETIGWKNEVTGTRREEVTLSLKDFLCPELSICSARRGIRQAEEAGLIIRTASATPNEPARYAIRWDDGEAQREAIERERRANRDSLADSDDPDRGIKLRPLKSRGLTTTPPILLKKPSPEKEILDGNGETNPLSVIPGEAKPENHFATANGGGGDAYKRLIASGVRQVLELTDDHKSTGRWVQLYRICLEKSVTDAWMEALFATFQAKARETGQGREFNAGRYFNSVCVKELDRRGVIVPKKADLESPEADEIRAMIRAELGLLPQPDASASAEEAGGDGFGAERSRVP